MSELTVQLSWFENKAAFLNECPIFFVQTHQDKQIHVPIFTGQEVLMNNKFLFLGALNASYSAISDQFLTKEKLEKFCLS